MYLRTRPATHFCSIVQSAYLSSQVNTYYIVYWMTDWHAKYRMPSYVRSVIFLEMQLMRLVSLFSVFKKLTFTTYIHWILNNGRLKWIYYKLYFRRVPPDEACFARSSSCPGIRTYLEVFVTLGQKMTHRLRTMMILVMYWHDWICVVVQRSIYEYYAYLFFSHDVCPYVVWFWQLSFREPLSSPLLSIKAGKKMTNTIDRPCGRKQVKRNRWRWALSS